MGWNGLPRGVNDSDAKRNERPTKYDFYSHAEENAICNAAALGVSLRGSTIYVTHIPCPGCTRMIIQSGIKQIVVGIQGEETGTHSSRSRQESNRHAAEMLSEAGVSLRLV